MLIKKLRLAKFEYKRYKLTMKTNIACPHCGLFIPMYKNPAPTTDVIIYDPHNKERGIVLIERMNPPHGFALPGGFVDEGESVEHAAVREMLEETKLKIKLEGLLGVYSHPKRDPRSHTLSIVFVGKALNADELCAGDDAKNAAFYPLDALPPLVFDHMHIVEDYQHFLAQKRHLAPISHSALEK